ncbi:hypothetical protein GCM10010211_33400 [Streptomyces albospinus]|uniref:Uncharacterized protein n=1 Tax=Streptomyces albospinus TaxID=285515 RepID=A0ABQ2V2K7_9ACTN|nr:hypothetical protein [Streptomyces albospinus]GGU65544.1 hypothetical protein GCM10010211_33400 [Streptomyces albospinus]
MSAPALRRGVGTLMATAIAGTAGVALAGPVGATTSYGHPHQKVIVIVVNESRHCRDFKVVKVVVVEMDRKVIIIKKFQRCDFRRHNDYFAKRIFFKRDFRTTHKVFVDKARARGTVPLAPAKVPVDTNPIRVSINAPRTSMNPTSPTSLGSLTPGHVNVSSSGVTAGSGATGVNLGAGGVSAGSGAAGVSLGSGGNTAHQ